VKRDEGGGFGKIKITGKKRCFSSHKQIDGTSGDWGEREEIFKTPQRS